MTRSMRIVLLTPEERTRLEEIVQDRTMETKIVNRARILLMKADRDTVDGIAEKIGINRKSVMLCLNKFEKGGVESALQDAPKGRPVKYSDEAKAWVLDLRRQKLTNFGYTEETWTVAKLTEHIHKYAIEAGFPELTTINMKMVYYIMKRNTK